MVMKYNAETFPESANAHDSDGEALLETRQANSARLHFEKAIALATAAGKSPNAIAGMKANLARAEKALGTGRW